MMNLETDYNVVDGAHPRGTPYLTYDDSLQRQVRDRFEEIEVYRT